MLCVWEQVCIDTVSYFSPGRSRTDAEISAASGQSFSTNSRGPHRDLLKPRKDFFTGGSKKNKTVWHTHLKKPHVHTVLPLKSCWFKKWQLIYKYIYIYSLYIYIICRNNQMHTPVVFHTDLNLLNIVSGYDHPPYLLDHVWDSAPWQRKTAVEVGSPSPGCVRSSERTRSDLWCSAWPCWEGWPAPWTWGHAGLQVENDTEYTQEWME